MTALVCAALLSCEAGCRSINHSKKPKPDPYQDGCHLPDCTPIGWIWPRGASGGAVPYVPREGDILFTSSIDCKQSLGYALLARIGLPHHVLMIVRRSDGQLATFEVGSGGDQSVAMRPIYTRLHKQKKIYRGAVTAIRQIKRPLSPEESHCLTCFAESQVGKPFSKTAEFLPLALPGRPFPPTCNSQETWYCSEIVVQALRVAGLLHGVDVPRKLVPEDMYHDDQYDLSALWTYPSEWTSDKCIPTLRPRCEPARIPNPSVVP